VRVGCKECTGATGNEFQYGRGVGGRRGCTRIDGCVGIRRSFFVETYLNVVGFYYSFRGFALLSYCPCWFLRRDYKTQG